MNDSLLQYKLDWILFHLTDKYMVKKYDIDDKWLRENYIENGYSMNKIAKYLGISTQVVSRIISEHGIRDRYLDRLNTGEKTLRELEDLVFKYKLENPKSRNSKMINDLGISYKILVKVMHRMNEDGKMRKLNIELNKIALDNIREK